MTAILTECSYNLSLLSNRKISQLTAKTDSGAKILTIGNVVIDFNCIQANFVVNTEKIYFRLTECPLSSEWKLSDLNIPQIESVITAEFVVEILNVLFYSLLTILTLELSKYNWFIGSILTVMSLSLSLGDLVDHNNLINAVILEIIQ